MNQDKDLSMETKTNLQASAYQMFDNDEISIRELHELLDEAERLTN